MSVTSWQSTRFIELKIYNILTGYGKKELPEISKSISSTNLNEPIACPKSGAIVQLLNSRESGGWCGV